MNPLIILAGLKKIGSYFITKKRVIGWIAAVALAVGAAAAGMSTEEFRQAVIDAPVIKQPVEEK
jgi:hypothetical protein